MKQVDYTIHKKPTHVNDSLLITFHNFPVSVNACKNFAANDDYVKVKRLAFLNKDSSKNQFAEFKYRPSFGSLDRVRDLSGTVYTAAVSRKNDGVSYEHCMVKIRSILQAEPNSRRAVLRFTDSITDFSNSVQRNSQQCEDISCISHIQYMQDRAYMVMRASDIYNEFIPDVLLINEFFLSPVYGNTRITLEFFASTTQNNEYIHRTCSELCNILEQGA